MFTWGMASMVFLSLAKLNPKRAEELYERVEKDILKQVEATREIATGLREQLFVQLEMLKNTNIPYGEIICIPGLFDPIAMSDKQYFTFSSLLLHPFSRGNIVSCSLLFKHR